MMQAALSIAGATDDYNVPPADGADLTSEDSSSQSSTSSSSQSSTSSSSSPPSPAMMEGRHQTLGHWPDAELPKRTLAGEGQAMEEETGMMMEAALSTTAAAGENKTPPADLVDFTSVARPSQSSTSSSSQPLQSLATVEGRLQTFKNWPVSFLSAKEMAAAGFCFLNRDDAVQCVYCGVVISRWQVGDKALEEHRKWAPECEFANPRQRRCVDAISYDSCRPFDPPVAGQQRRPQPPPPAQAKPVQAKRPTWAQFRTREARLATFKDWPPAIPVKPATLSEAGFFYSGVGDRTVCYYCGQGLRDWEAGDDPWLEHELWFPGCWHVLLHKGNNFVKAVAEKRDALIAAKKNPRETVTVTLAESTESKQRDVAPGNEVRKNSVTEEKGLCKICFENEMSVVFLPCGHIVACVDCALSCEYCPVCREPFQNTARVYLP